MKIRRIVQKFMGSSEEYVLEHRLLNLIAFTGILTNSIAVILNLFGEYTALDIFVQFLLIGITISFYWKSMKDKKYQRLYYAGVFLVSFVILPFSWFKSGGLFGTVTMYVIIQSGYIAVLGKQHSRKILMAMLFVYAILIGIQYHHPDVIMNIHSRGSHFLDMTFSFFMMLVINFLVITFVIREYDKEKKKIEKLNDKNSALAEKLEFAFLNAQIKPHFVFNVLNTILSYTGEDDEKVSELLIAFSKHLRGTLDMKNLNDVDFLEKELEYIKAYVLIEQARFDTIDVVYVLDEGLNIKIPTLTIQPLVENAILHGLRKKEGMGRVILSILAVSGAYEISVEDDGVGISDEDLKQILEIPKENEGIGLYNINKRLQKRYGKGIQIKSTLGEGTRVGFKVPFERKDNHESNSSR